MMNKQIFYFILIIVAFASCKKESDDTATNNSNSKLLYAARGQQAGIFDQQGRYVILRGANYNVLGDYWQANSDVATVKEYSANDFEIMASYGFNCIRLVFNWSMLEPERGKYNQAYINKIKQAIEDAAKHNIYVLVDMHQDAYSKFIFSQPSENCENPLKGWDGAPAWAVITDDEPTCMQSSGGVGGRETSKAVVQAFQHFWDNTDGIQDACINAWTELVKQVANYENVLGYDMINEPSLGNGADLFAEVVKLGNFYNKLGTSIRDVEKANNLLEHTLFFEMTVSWDGQPIPFIPSSDFTKIENICFAPHSYFEAISYLLTVEFGYDLLKSLSKGYETGMLMGEYGFFEDTTTAVPKLIRFAKKEDQYFHSSTIWSWAQAPGDPHVIDFSGNNYPATEMAMAETDVNGKYTGRLKTSYLNVLSRTRPNAIVGYPIFLESDPLTGKMQLKANSTKAGNTILWIPDRFGTPIITGTNVKNYTLNKVSGGYLAEVSVEGNYEILVGF